MEPVVKEVIDVKAVMLTPNFTKSQDFQTEFRFKYNNNLRQTLLGKGWSSFFNSSKPVESCKLLSSDCASPYLENFISIGGSSPFQMFAITKNVEGYKTMVCL